MPGWPPSARYVYERANPRGWHLEWWLHAGGCRALLKIVRHTLTHEIRWSATRRRRAVPARGALMRGPGPYRARPADRSRPADRLSLRRPRHARTCRRYAGLGAAGQRPAAGRAQLQVSPAARHRHRGPRGAVCAGGRDRRRRARTQPARHHAGAAPGTGGREPEPLAVAAFRPPGAQRPPGALPARGLLLQDLHGARLGLGAAVRAADPPCRGPGPPAGDRAASTRRLPRRCTITSTCWWSARASPALPPRHRLGRSGLRVLLAEQDVVLGGGALLDERWRAWREATCAALAALAASRCLARTTVLGAYGHGVFGALETLSPDEAARASADCASGCASSAAGACCWPPVRIERLIAFPGNDLPGVMLAGAALGYLRRYGVAVGRRPAYFVNNDEAYDAVFALHACRHRLRGRDRRACPVAGGRPRPRPGHRGARRRGGRGGRRARRGSAVRIARRDGGARRELEADCLLMSGGYSPASALASQLGAGLTWQESIAAFTPRAGRRRTVGSPGRRAVCSGLRPRPRTARPRRARSPRSGQLGSRSGTRRRAAGQPRPLPPDPEAHADQRAVASAWPRQGIR